MANNPLLTNTGTAIGTNLISGLGGTVPKYIGHGIGTTAPAVTDSGLQTPSADARATGTVTRITTTVTNDTVQAQGTVSIGSTQASTESAQFDAVSSGNIFTRGTYAALNVISGDSIQFTWKDQLLAG